MHLLLTATTEHKKTLTQRQQVGSHYCHMSTTLASPFIAYWSDFQIFKDPVSFAPLSIFAFSPFRRQTSNLGHAQVGEIRWLCLPRERLRKDLRRPSVYVSGWSSDPTTIKPLKRAKKITSPGKENLTSRVTSLLEFKCPVQEKNHKAYKEIGKYGAFKEKKKINRNYRWKKDLIPDQIHKDCKITVTWMLKELMEELMEEING